MDPSKAQQLLRRHRLANQRLTGEPFASAVEAVQHLGAVQAQDYAAAKWAVAQRTTAATDETLERAIDHGQILRTHVLRPTWHLVAARDIKWMLALTGPRIAAGLVSMWRRSGLDVLFKRSNNAIVKALGEGEHLTRAELAEILRRSRIDVGSTERLGHIMLRAELDAIICSGARRGKQSTYALLEARAVDAVTLTRDEALRELAIRYFSTRGPATAKDFSWWSGLTVTDARKAARLADDLLSLETIDGSEMWVGKNTPPIARGASVHLLPNFDEFLVAYADRTAMAGALGALNSAEAKRAIFSNVIEINGQVAGTWQRTLARNHVSVELAPRRTVTAAERKAIGAQVQRYGEFIGLKSEIVE
ncbi:MAG TPA: winged helix DNA-binding domain-containing protein [Gemmatimonadaceae bacterium]|jgi:hypothetical protein